MKSKEILYIRFQHFQDSDGVFQYISKSLARLPRGKRYRELSELRDWFQENLVCPRAYGCRFWFHARARVHIRKARRMAALISAAGYPMRERRVRIAPGTIIWQDANQIAFGP